MEDGTVNDEPIRLCAGPEAPEAGPPPPDRVAPVQTPAAEYAQARTEAATLPGQDEVYVEQLRTREEIKVDGDRWGCRGEQRSLP